MPAEDGYFHSHRRAPKTPIPGSATTSCTFDGRSQNEELPKRIPRARMRPSASSGRSPGNWQVRSPEELGDGNDPTDSKARPTRPRASTGRAGAGATCRLRVARGSSSGGRGRAGRRGFPTRDSPPPDRDGTDTGSSFCRPERELSRLTLMGRPMEDRIGKARASCPERAVGVGGQ